MTSLSKSTQCLFCEALEQAAAEGSLVVHVARHSFVLVNLHPYNAGHVMVAPKRHVATLSAATEEELSEIMALARRLEAALDKSYEPDGVNLGMNLGRSAGASAADHLHLHLVPRWTGDTSFMTVVGETRVTPEDPRETRRRLRRELE